MGRSNIGPVVLALLASCTISSGQESAYSRDHHAWVRFPIGSWKLVRTSAESIDDKGQITNPSSTDTRATLLGADDAAYTLRSEITVNIAGRRIAMTPQTVKHGYYGEPAGRPLAIKQLGEAPVT